MPKQHKTRLVVEIADVGLADAHYLRSELPKLALIVVRELRRRREMHEQLISSCMGDAAARRPDMQLARVIARAAHRRKSAQREQAHRRGKQPRRRHLALGRR